MSSASPSVDGRRNNYDVLRLIAAVLVVVSHAFALTGRVEPAVPLTDDTLGFDGVLIFFAISGMLVTRSWAVDPRFVAFAWKRFLRVVPGLLVANVVTAYAIVPFFSSWRPADYLTSSGPLRYVVTNTAMLTNHSLPGAFPDNPSPTPNGSLGTLPIEIKAYVLLALVGLAIAVASVWLRAGLLLLAGAALVGAPLVGLAPPGKVVHLFAVFAGAAAFELLRARIPLRLPLFLACAGLWVASYHLPFVGLLVLQAVAVPYLVAFLGHHGLSRLRVLTRPGDVSYGLYIYAFPVEQAVVALIAPSHSPLLVTALALPATYGLALASWRWIERPALARKTLLARPGAVAEPAAGRGTDDGPVSPDVLPESAPTSRRSTSPPYTSR